MTRKNLILGGILAALVAMAYLYQGPWQDWRQSLGRPDNFFKDLAADNITVIEITAAGKTTRLVKTGGRWKIDGTRDFYLAAAEQNDLEATLYELPRAEIELVSSNRAKDAEFETGEGGRRIVFKQGEAVAADFIMGKLARDYLSTYVRPADSDRTYALKKNISQTFGRESWYDREIFAGEAEAISKIRFQYPGREFTVEKKEDGWTGVAPYAFSVADDKIEPVVSIMANLTAAGVPEDQTFAGTGLEKHSLIVEAAGEGLAHTLMAGDQNEDGLYFAKRGDSDNIYLIGGETYDQLDLTIRDLR